MPDEQAITPVDVITRHCRYTGSVATRGFRLSDLLSDSRTSILEMRAALSTLAGDRSRDVRWKEVSVKKDRILLVIPKGSYEAPVRRRNYYQKKHHYGAMIVLPGCVLSGIVQVPSRATALTLLDETGPLPSFIGVTDVTVHGSVHDLLPSRCDVVILRRQAIESIQLTDQPLSRQEQVAGEQENEPRATLRAPNG